jgi:hypothetical protein
LPSRIALERPGVFTASTHLRCLVSRHPGYRLAGTGRYHAQADASKDWSPVRALHRKAGLNGAAG